MFKEETEPCILSVPDEKILLISGPDLGKISVEFAYKGHSMHVILSWLTI